MKKLKVIFSIAAACALGTAILAGCGGKKDEETACAHTNLEKVDGRNSNCYEEGNYTYWKCGCGALFSDKNANKPTTAEDVKIEKTRHAMHYYDEKVAVYDGYYFCDTCGRFYEDGNGKFQIPYDELLDSSVKPVQLENGWFDPAGVNAENRDFTIRCFVGWSSQGTDISAFPDSGTAWVNVNLNRKVTITTNDGWYNFGVAYNKANGLQYKNFEAGNLTKVAPEFTELFLKNGGIWVRVVREGTKCSFYFEDKYGIPILISSNANFGADEALCRFAFGQYEEVSGWQQAPSKAEICWGIANPRCVFGN